jgi:hypothetical protein
LKNFASQVQVRLLASKLEGFAELAVSGAHDKLIDSVKMRLIGEPSGRSHLDERRAALDHGIMGNPIATLRGKVAMSIGAGPPEYRAVKSKHTVPTERGQGVVVDHINPFTERQAVDFGDKVSITFDYGLVCPRFEHNIHFPARGNPGDYAATSNLDHLRQQQPNTTGRRVDERDVTGFHRAVPRRQRRFRAFGHKSKPPWRLSRHFDLAHGDVDMS